MDKPAKEVKFAVTVVTYYPPAELFPRLEALLDAGFALAIYNNGPAKLPDVEKIGERALWMGGDGQNHGLGRGMRALMEAVSRANYPWALYLDQDTCVGVAALQWMQAQLERNAASLGDVAAVQCTASEVHADFREKSLLINSGCLFHLPLLETWGGHDPSFFVECVDYKFCLDAVYHGYRLMEWPGCPGFDHDSLQPKVRYQMGSRQIPVRPYPLHRHQAFLGALLRLAGIAFKRLQWMYAFRFSRNILTHLLKQLQFGLLSLGSRFGVVKKMLSFVIVVFNMLIE